MRTCTWLSSHSKMAADGSDRLPTMLLSACTSTKSHQALVDNWVWLAWNAWSTTKRQLLSTSCAAGKDIHEEIGACPCRSVLLWAASGNLVVLTHKMQEDAEERRRQQMHTFRNSGTFLMIS